MPLPEELPASSVISADFKKAREILISRNLETSENINQLNKYRDNPYEGLARIILESSGLYNEENLAIINQGVGEYGHYLSVILADLLVFVKRFNLKPETKEKILKHASVGLLIILNKIPKMVDINDEIINTVLSGNISLISLKELLMILEFEKEFSIYQKYIPDIIKCGDPGILMSVIIDLKYACTPKTHLLSETFDKLLSNNGLDYAVGLSLLNLAHLLNENNILKVLHNTSLDGDAQHILEKLLIRIVMSTNEFQWLKKYNILEIAEQLHLTSEKFIDFIKLIDLKSIKNIDDLNNIIQGYIDMYPKQVLEVCSVYKHKDNNGYLDQLSNQARNLIYKYLPNKITDTELLHVFTTYQRIKGGQQLPESIWDGLCFGSALCHGVFKTLGKGIWWKALLEEIVKWDRRQESLSNLVHLPDSAEPYTLELLIKMAGNFILNNETMDLTANNYELSFNLKQRKLLIPGGPFRVITASGQKNIQDKLSLVLYGDDDLEKFIEKFKQCYNNNEIICLLYKQLHVCSLNSENGLYLFNSNHGDSGPIETINTIWKKMRQEGPKVLGIDLISLEDKINPELIKLCDELTNRAIKKIDPAQFKMFIKIMPQRMTQLLKEVADDIDNEVLLANALVHQQSSSSINNLQVLVFDAPEVLPVLLDLVKSKPALQISFMQAFSAKYEDCTVFELIVHFAAALLPKLFELSHALPALENNLEQSLLNNVKGITTFRRMISCAPSYLPAFFKLLEGSEKLQNSLAQTLHLSAEQNLTSAHLLAIETPNYFTDFLSVMGNNAIFKTTFSKLLAVKTDFKHPGWPLLHLIIKYAPNCLPQLISLAKANKEIMLAIYNVLPLPVSTNVEAGKSVTLNGFELVSHYAAEYEPLMTGLYALATPTITNMNTTFCRKRGNPSEESMTSTQSETDSLKKPKIEV